MRPFRRPWILYVLFLAVGLGAMGWITHLALKSEQAELQAQARAMVEEKARLALWRMDSTMALFLSPETARPWHHFETFHRENGRPVPSPMLLMDDPMVLLRFQIDAQGRFSAPLAAEGAWKPLAARAVNDPARLTQAAERLAAVERKQSLASIRAAMLRQGAVLLSREQMRDLRSRSRKVDLALPSPYLVNQGVWAPFWADGEIFLARQVWVGDREILQGMWLEWDAVKEVLLSAVRDLLPEADLQAASEGAARDRDRRMGSLPLKLVPGHLRVVVPRVRTPARAALALGWIFALIGAGAGGLVLRHALELSERRGTFASAVTHELRTPLTTFRLYTELLAKGMVPDPEERRFLLATLLEEADRLDHLVKNVLAFARLEARRETALETLPAADLLDRPMARLQARAAQAGLSLETKVSAEAKGCRLRTDPLLVEQILFNLVDNAAKYASGARDPRIHLEASAAEGRLSLRIRDHGPGIDPADRRHLFRPFHKSAQKAARTAPGVGLGLPLSRKLARSLGGELEVDDTVRDGACFVLRLPVAAG